MIYLKNKKNGQISKFSCPQGQWKIEKINNIEDLKQYEI